MSLFPASSADYSDRDQAALEVRIRSLVDSVFPTWSDKSRANFGNVLLSSFAFVGDVLGFYQDGQAAESRLVTAQQRRNILKLVKMLDYSPRTAAPARATLTVSVSPAPVANVTLPIGTIAKTEDVADPVEFQFLTALVLTPGVPSNTVLVENSATKVEIFISDGLANQSFLLSNAPYLDDSLSVVAVDGTYTQVDNFLSSVATSKHFTVQIDNNDRATVKFGNGVNGAIPSAGNVTFTHKTGGGVEGIVEAGTIKSLSGNFTDSLGNPVTITVTNVLASSGGADRESEISIKENAPLSVRTAGRTISREDYEIHGKLVAGVERTLMLTSSQDPAIAANTGWLYLVPAGLGFPAGTDSDGSSVLWQAKQFCTVTYPNPPTFVLNVIPPVYLDVGVTARIYLKAGYNGAAVAASIRAALVSYFALRNADGTTNTSVDFGWNVKSALAGNPPAGEIPLSDIYNVVRDVAGVRKVGDTYTDFELSATRKFSDLTSTVVQASTHNDVPVAIRDFPRLAAVVTLINGDTGLAI